MKGYVYVLSNPSMPGIVKIGRSCHGGKKRAIELYNTGVPNKFNLEFEILSDHCAYLEKCVHAELDEYRFNKSREFFRMDVCDAIMSIVKAFSNDYGNSIVESEWDDAIESIENIAHIINEHVLIVAASVRHLDPSYMQLAVDQYHENIAKFKAGATI